MSFIARIASLTLVVGFLAGCVFDPKGLPGDDGSFPDQRPPDKLRLDLPVVPDQGPDVVPVVDLALDLAPDVVDLSPDISVDPKCKGGALRACSNKGPGPGESGHCVNG